MNFRLEQIIKENDLYSFIEEGHTEDLENLYIMRNDVRVFIGCSINGTNFLKRFFCLGKREAMVKNIPLYTEMACVSEDKVLVILNPNYSRNSQIPDIFTDIIKLEREKSENWENLFKMFA